MGKIYIARHGQDQDNAAGILNGHRDTLLTELGMEQAYALAEKVALLGITRIISSPLIRAYQTARVSQRRIKLSDDRISIHPKLIERNFGSITGMRKTELPNITRDFIQTDHTYFCLDAEGGETYPEAYERAHMLLLDVGRVYHEDNLLMVCHGDIGNMIRAAYYGIDWEEMLRTHSTFSNCDVIQLSQEMHAGCLIT